MGSTASPTASPTAAPTGAPTSSPTSVPTSSPTDAPTATPTAALTATPTSAPTAVPTFRPTAAPTAKPTSAPTATPTTAPTGAPTSRPTAVPTAAPTVVTAAPTEFKSGPIACINDKAFRLNEGKKKHCAYIMFKEPRRQRLCQQNRVRIACPSTCGIDGCCTDRDTFRFKNGKNKKKSCEWVDVNKNRRKTYCKRRRVEAECVNTCNNCQPLVVKL